MGRPRAPALRKYTWRPRLFQQGQDVILIARGPHLEAIQRDGLKFITPSEQVNLPIKAVAHPSEIEFRDDDVVFLSMKSQHTLAALDHLRVEATERTAVICCQNGVANERMALRRFRNTYAMVVILPALHLEPGIVITHAADVGGILDMGCYPQGVDGCVEAVTRHLREAGFSAEPDSEVMRQKYAKLLMNLNNALQAATEMRGEARDISRLMREEALACYRAARIDCATAD
ncbi:MAG: 2-dehydropantoate 2-reductase N-terminal domain-containing protein, partial [Gammaproteobacteria bacterium]